MSAQAPAIAAVTSAAAPGFASRLLRRPLAVICIGYLLVVVTVAIVAPIALPGVAGEHAGNLFEVQQGPSGAHLLGTDALGRDVLQRLLVGSRVTLVGVAQALAVVLALGVPLGLVAGYFRGRSDRVIGWFADLAFSMPHIVVVLVVLSVFTNSMAAAMVTFGILIAPALMRIVRASTLAVREELYITAARASGLSHARILARHVLPRIAGPVIVQASLIAAVALLAQTGLAFLQLVVQAPEPSWGGMVADGLSVLYQDSWLIVPPGVAIAVTVLALGLLGDAVRDATAEAWSAPARPQRRSRPARETASAPPPPDVLLSVQRLSVTFGTAADRVRVVEDVSFDVREGETLGMVGESGCGKTVTASAILGLLPGTGQVEDGGILFGGTDISALAEREMHRLRGREIGFVSQEPMVGLDPAFRVGSQVAEAVARHHGVSRKAAAAKALELLESVRLPDARTVARRYPHELSGGMAQRVAIARALAGEPRLLIADEPTTALDVTVQREILALLDALKRKTGMAIMLVTHDWGVVADLCDRAVVMYAGQVVESGPVTRIFHGTRHPYTQGLLAANPQVVATNAEAASLATIPGVVPSPRDWPAGCHFHPRCPHATEACEAAPIPLEDVEPDMSHLTRCIHHDELLATGSRR